MSDGHGMKTIEDLKRRIFLEVTHWHSRRLSCDGFLWFVPAIPGRNGGVLVAREQPAPEYQLVTSEPIRMSARDTVQKLFALGVLGRLPVLGEHEEITV